MITKAYLATNLFKVKNLKEFQKFMDIQVWGIDFSVTIHTQEDSELIKLKGDGEFVFRHPHYDDRYTLPEFSSEISTYLQEGEILNLITVNIDEDIRTDQLIIHSSGEYMFRDMQSDSSPDYLFSLLKRR